ncbi:unnamed protein product, partial [Brassica rapa]
THTDVLCVLTDSHGRPVCAGGHPRTHTDTHGHTLTAMDVLCVLMDSHRQPQLPVYWRTPTNVLCVLNRQPTWTKITQTVHGKGQRAKSKDQRADMCTDGQPWTSCPRTSCVCWRTPTDTHGHTLTAMDVLCVLMDSHRQPQLPVYWRTPTNVLCVLNRQPTWTKITQTVHGKGQRAKSKDQRADMCTDGQPRTSYTDGHTWTLTDTHRRPVCASGHPQKQLTWAKITRTVHGKGQRAESKDQRADMCTDGQPRAKDVLCVMTDTHRRPVCVLTDTHGRPVCTEQIAHGQRAESKDQRADMCTDGQPQTCCVC